jgi:Cys-tRNA(Pro) deacylase
MSSAKGKSPVTPAARLLKSLKTPYQELFYDFVEQGGTSHLAKELQLDEHAVIKTLIFETDAKKPLLVLMHGDRNVSTKNLARLLGVKAVAPCDPAQAERNSGYRVGGTSPFATRKAMPIYIEKTILELPRIYINGGHRGFILAMDPAELVRILKPTPLNVAIAD